MMPQVINLRINSGRRGSAYVFVLGITLIVTVLGMGALTLSRVNAKVTGSANDWEAAGDLAFSATEHAMSYLNAAASAFPSTWRSSYTSRQTAFTQSIGRGTFSWALKDEVDGNLAADYLRPFRIYGIGKVGAVTRVYSVQAIPGGSPLDLLRCAVQSSGTVTVTGSTQAINGPVSSNTSVSLSGTFNGSVEAPSVSGNSDGDANVEAPMPGKPMPSTTIYNDLLQNATPIDYSAISGTLEKCLLSATSNPFGTVNPNGIYCITLAGNKTLKIQNCRIVGTLLISAPNKDVVQINGPVEWEANGAGNPILVVSGAAVQVAVSGSNTWLSENSAGVNFNPAGTPYSGSTDSDLSDDYPPQLQGIIHIIGGSASTVQFNGNAYINGTLITDCPVKTSGQTTFVQNPAIFSNPPFGYCVGDAVLEVPGTWRWDTLP